MAYAQNRYIVTLPHVLAKASDKASPDSKGGEIDSTFWCEQLQSGISADSGHVFSLPQRVQNILKVDKWKLY